MESFVQSVVSGVLTGSLYAMIAIGLTIVFGVMRIINLAHGEMVMLGMFGAYWSYTLWGIDPFLSIVIWAPLMFAGGMLVHRFLLKDVIPRGELNTLLYTAGFSLLVANLALFFWTGDYRTLNLPYALMPARPFGIAVPISLAIAFAMAIALTGALYLLLSRTDVGRAIRATAQNREAAQLMGVRVSVVYAQVLALSGALAALSGIMVSSLSGLLPNMGGDPMLKAFIICVVAGLGNVYGAVIAALALGLLEAYIQYVLGVRYSFAILLLLVIVVLIWRPYGLFGRRQVVRL